MRTLAHLVVALLVVAPPARADLVDRVLATVAGRTITLSDVRMVKRFGLLAPAGTSDDVLLDRLVERALVLEEVERYAPPDPAAADVQRLVAEVRGRFASAEAFAIALSVSGIQEGGLLEWVRNDLRIEYYLQQRFAGSFEPSEQDLEAYTRTHRAELEAGSRSLDDPDVQRLIRERATAERREAVVSEWIEGLRARAAINRPPGPVP